MSKHLFFCLLLFITACTFWADDSEQGVVIFSTFENSVVMVYQGLYFDAKLVSKPELFKRIEKI
ncbi:MAG: hypothetical protein JXD23_09760 [Spirochaetales bacterium]|nr:hypothetical protein [Spirochaetales bacterium]